MSEQPTEAQAPPAPPPPPPDPSEDRTGREDRANASGELAPRPTIERASKTAFLIAAVVGLGVLAVLSFRYSRDPGGGVSPERARFERPGLTPEQLERLRPPAPPRQIPELGGFEAEPAEASEPPVAARPAPRPRGERPRRSAPLGVSLPANPHARRSSPSARELLGSAPPGPEVTGPEATGTVQGSATERDPRQLPRPETHAVRVELGPPLTDYQLQAGTYVPAVLTHRVGSGIGGMLRARVAVDLYDSATARHVLIPRGTVVLGAQARQPLLGESRLLVAWHRLILPDGRSFVVSEDPAAAPDGSLGAVGEIRRHWGRRFGAAALLSLVGAGFQISQDTRQGLGAEATAGEEIAGAVGTELSRVSTEILREHARLPPTITLEPGARIHMLVTRDLAFEAPYQPSRPR